MTHPSADVLVAYADGELNDPGITAHIAACDECSSMVATQRAVRTAIRNIPETFSTAPTDFTQILKRFERRRTRQRFVVFGAGLAAACAMIMLRIDRQPTHTAEIAAAITANPGAVPAADVSRMDDLITTMNDAIAQTRSAIEHDRTNAFLRGHLADLEARRMQALSDIAEVIGERSR